MMKDEDFKRITVEELQNPGKSGLYKLYIDHWWATDINDLLLLYQGTRPQCNSDINIVKHLSRVGSYQEGEPVFLTKAFVPVKLKDLM